MALLFVALAAAAFAGGWLVYWHPGLAIPIPVLAVFACLARRFPAATVLTLFTFTGAYGTIVAYLHLPLSLVDLLFNALWVAAVWTLIIGRRRRKLALWPGLVALAVYHAVTLFQIFAGPDPKFSLEIFVNAGWYALGFFMLVYFPWGPRSEERIVRGVAVVALAVGAYAVFRWIVGPGGAEVAYGKDTYNLVDGEIRLFGSLPTGLELGLWTGLAVPFTCALALMWRGRWRLLALAACLLSAAALVGSEVRTALVGAVVGLVLVFVLHHATRAAPGVRLGATALAVVGAIGLGFVLLSFTSAGDARSEHRLTRIFHPESDPAFQARLTMWRTAIPQIEDRPFGHGIGTGGRLAPKSKIPGAEVGGLTVDNAYLKIAWEQGLLVAGLFVAALLMLLWGIAARSVLTRDPSIAALGIAGAGSLAGYGVMLLFLGLHVEGLGALAAWILIALGARQFVFAAPEPVAAPAVPERAARPTGPQPAGSPA